MSDTIKQSFVFIDPPSGWKYGFPRKVEIATLNDPELFRAWLIECGYPEKDVEFALKYCRYWSEG